VQGNGVQGSGVQGNGVQGSGVQGSVMGSGLLEVCSRGQKLSVWAEFVLRNFDRVGRAAFWRKICS
jgi:hypothetical protein